MGSPALTVVPEPSTWSPQNLTDAVSGNYSGPQPSLLGRSDGMHLMYPGKLHSVAGPPGGAKSWIAQVLCSQVLLAGGVVLYIDFEDAAESVVSRLRILGVPSQTILDRFGYVSPSEPLPSDGVAELEAWIAAADLVVLDGVTDAMTLHQWNPLDNKDAAEFMQRLVGPFATGARRPAVLMVDHVTKSRDDRGRYALGAQHKLAAVQVQFTVETLTPFDQDHDGVVALTVTKDRYGQVQRLTDVGGSKEVARFHFHHPVPGNEAMTVRIDPPMGDTDSGEATHDLSMLWEILEVVGHSESGAIKSQIKQLVKRRDSLVMKGVDHLHELGLIEGAPSGRTVAYRPTRPIEGLSPTVPSESTDCPLEEPLSVAEVAQILNPSSVLPGWMSVPVNE